MEWLALGIAVLGILVAIFIPLWIEYLKRPRLRIERADDANQTEYSPHWRIVHVRVVNVPIGGRLGAYLLRNPAPGCQVMIRLTSSSDQTTLDLLG